ncbi:oligoribonuclease NrnB [Bacillus subtilis]|nr:oligoribonuclease NrnB [Bacillus subtilis]
MYHLYSHNDLDGVGCGIIAKLAFGKDVEVRYNSVNGLNAQVQYFLEKAKESNRQDALFITDLAVNEENEERLNEYVHAGGKVKLIDHHKTALHLNEHEWGFVQVEYDDGRLTSATSLLYGYLVENGFMKPTNALDQFTELVRQYDTWEWERYDQKQAKRLNDLFFLLSIDEFEAKMIQRLSTHDEFFFDDFEEKLLDLEDEKIERYLRRKKREMVQTFVHEHCVGIVHAESYHSELGNRLGKDNPHLDYIAILSMGSKRVSLRTIHDYIDVSEIAGRYGGGGHAKASGCSITDEVYELFVAEAFRIDPVRPDAFRNIYNLKGSANGSLYENRAQMRFFLFPLDNEWNIQINGETQDETFAAFEEAEWFIKRNYAASLVRDEVFVAFLAENLKLANQHRK